MNYLKKIGLGLLLSVFLTTSLITLQPNKAFAADVQATWLDAATIDLNGIILIDDEIGDSMDYKGRGADGCEVSIKNFNNNYSDNPDFSSAIYHSTVMSASGQCEEQPTQTVELLNTHDAQAYARWIDSGTLQLVGGVDYASLVGVFGVGRLGVNPRVQGALFQQSPEDPNTYFVPSGDCRSSIAISNRGSSTSSGEAILTVRSDGTTGCGIDEGESVPIRIGSFANANKPAGTGSAPGSSPLSEDGNSCEAAGGAMGWIMCPVVNLIDGSLNWLDTQIQGLLSIDENKYTDPQLKLAWQTFRNIAFIILIPIMLVMVIGTALGMEMFSAYTVKKALPRMVIAAIFITLSWYICSFLISLFNVVGGGLLGLMTTPFGESGNMNLSTLFGGSGQDYGGAVAQWMGGSAMLIALAALVTTPGGLGLILLYLAPILLAVGGAFLVLLLRQLFIIALILLAPLAILAWIFPGNDKLWKFWWGTFSKLLIMFPLIMVIIGAGRIFAWLLNETGGAGAVTPLLKLLAYTLPYIVIPFTFKFAGGVFANLAGFVDNKEKGLFDRMRKRRQENWSKPGGLKDRYGRGAAFDPNKANAAKGLRGRWMRGVNAAGQMATDPLNSTRIAMGSEKGRALLSSLSAGTMDHTTKLSEQLKSANDRSAKALALGVDMRDASGNLVLDSEGKPIKVHYDGTMKSIDAMAMHLDRTGDRMDRFGAEWLRNNAGFLTEAYKSEEYGRADVQSAAALAYAAQGFITNEEIAEVSARLQEESPGMATQMSTMLQVAASRGAGTRPGYSVTINAAGEYQAATIDHAMELAAKVDIPTLGGMKGGQLDANLADAYVGILTGDVKEQVQEADGSFKDRLEYNVNGQTGSVKLDSGTVQSTEDVLYQTYGSYNAPDTRNRIRNILTKSAEINARKENPDITDAEVQAAVKKVTDKLSRFGANTEDEINRQKADEAK